MTPASTDYYGLIASLPYLPRTFELDQLPISRFRLQKRLQLLSERDRSVVEKVQHFLRWDRQEPARTDDDVSREYERLMGTISNSLVRDIINHRIDVRTITCALRRRRLGLDPPRGVGRYVDHIKGNWHHPDFRLGRDHPWITAVRTNLEARRPLEVERQLLKATWDRWLKLDDTYHFSFEAVILYLARWEIIDRWTRLDAEAGRHRFDLLLQEALGDHARIDD